MFELVHCATISLVPDSSAARLMLLDTASLYFRAYFGIPMTMQAPDGTPVNAVRGMLDFLGFLVNKHEPARLVACLDADWRPAFRTDAVPSYKAHRVATGHEEEVPDELEVQVPIIVAALAALGVTSLGVAGFEADDVIGTLATRDRDVDIVTGDRDLFQLVDDDRSVRVLYTARGVGNIQIMDDSAIFEKYGVHGHEYADFATLRGDPSDGLPGVPGVGDKTAASLIRAYGDLAGVRAAALDSRTSLSKAQRRKITESADYLDVAPAVVAVRADVPIPSAFADRTPTEPQDRQALVDLDERWDLGSSLRRAEAALFGEAVTPLRADPGDPA